MYVRFKDDEDNIYADNCEYENMVYLVKKYEMKNGYFLLTLVEVFGEEENEYLYGVKDINEFFETFEIIKDLSSIVPCRKKGWNPYHE